MEVLKVVNPKIVVTEETYAISSELLSWSWCNSRSGFRSQADIYVAFVHIICVVFPMIITSRPTVCVFSLQMKYYTDCHRTYSDLCAQIDSGENVTTDSLNKTIQQKLSEIRALSISTTDDQF